MVYGSTKKTLDLNFPQGFDHCELLKTSPQTSAFVTYIDIVVHRPCEFILFPLVTHCSVRGRRHLHDMAFIVFPSCYGIMDQRVYYQNGVKASFYKNLLDSPASKIFHHKISPFNENMLRASAGFFGYMYVALVRDAADTGWTVYFTPAYVQNSTREQKMNRRAPLNAQLIQCDIDISLQPEMLRVFRQLPDTFDREAEFAGLKYQIASLLCKTEQFGETYLLAVRKKFCFKFPRTSSVMRRHKFLVVSCAPETLICDETDGSLFYDDMAADRQVQKREPTKAPVSMSHSDPKLFLSTSPPAAFLLGGFSFEDVISAGVAGYQLDDSFASFPRSVWRPAIPKAFFKANVPDRALASVSLRIARVYFHARVADLPRPKVPRKPLSLCTTHTPDANYSAGTAKASSAEKQNFRSWLTTIEARFCITSSAADQAHRDFIALFERHIRRNAPATPRARPSATKTILKVRNPTIPPASVSLFRSSQRKLQNSPFHP
eukprot:gnl/Chilomastix_cuspidata/4815.p1 GENE.gnl/Chilomastix_cuspidata/4815~~gnl/Chilomastix_cuspidata/4815.p1  ORF type:complete len:510 (-),score=149.97 gnl/Chilomastix_cuspidata/4815:293-1765(-)